MVNRSAKSEKKFKVEEPLENVREGIDNPRTPRSNRPRSEADLEYLRKLGRRVGSLRIQARLSREELAAKCGVHDSFLRKLEAGQANPSVLVLRAIAEGLTIEVKTLTDLSTTPPADSRLPRVRKSKQS